MSSVVVVGHPAAAVNLINELRRDHYHGLRVVGACLAGGPRLTEVAGVPVVGDLDDAADVVRRWARTRSRCSPAPRWTA